MKYLTIIPVVLFVGVFAVFVSAAPPACACGESYPGKVSWHWDEMTAFEKARYKITGHVPFDATGERL